MDDATGAVAFGSRKTGYGSLEHAYAALTAEMRSYLARKKKELTVNSEGVPVDLNAGMIEAVTNPPTGFVSKHKFVETDVAGRVRAIDWFARCGDSISLDLSMEIHPIRSWPQAVSNCNRTVWHNAELEAQNQLTVWLHLNAHASYQNWNDYVRSHKKTVVTPLTKQKIIPFQAQHGLDIAVVHCVQWDILGALMENTYLSSGHSAFFFLELLMVYEAGHFPCGWRGAWPQGKLIVF